MELIWTARRASMDLWVAALLSALVVLTLAYLGDAMGRMGSDADLDEPVEVRVIENDGAEPFVVCTIRPRVTRCRNLDLLHEGQP
jgi:hypothetical protein